MWAGTITDPAMAVEEGSYSLPITLGAVFGPSAAGGGQVGFYNGTGQYIISLGFQTFIRPMIPFGGFLDNGDPVGTLSEVFSCNDNSTREAANPYFLQCSFAYIPDTGELDIRFFDPRPVAGVPTNFLLGGIPPLPDYCLSNPDGPDCRTSAHFIITFNDNFAYDPDPSHDTPDDGGWSPDRNSGLFETTPSFTVTEIGTVPEPATFGPLSGALLLAGFKFRRRRG